MDLGIVIALLNPAISFVLAAAFFVLWLTQRRWRYLSFLAIGYMLTGVGFILQYVSLPVGFAATKFLSNLSFMGAAVLITVAICQRYRRPVPVVPLAAIATAGLGAFLWFLLVDADLTWRVYVMNFALGAITLLIAAEMRAVPDKTPIDKLLTLCALLVGCNFIVRVIVMVWLYGGFTGYGGFYTSPYWTTVLLSHAILSLTVALCLILGSALDVYAELNQESRTDPLSGLLNRRGFEQRTAAHFDGNEPVDAAVGLVVADLDHFKRINDRHGHAAGDAVIAAFASLLGLMAGDEGVVGRIGGEEFAVLLPGFDLPRTRQFAEGVRSALAAGSLSGLPDGIQGPTCSFGVTAKAGQESLAAMFERADEALLQAKRAGRNKVNVIYLRPAVPVGRTLPAA